MSRYKPEPRKGVTLGAMSARVSDDGSRVSVSIIDTPFELGAADASDLCEVLGDVMRWQSDDDDHEN